MDKFEKRSLWNGEEGNRRGRREETKRKKKMTELKFNDTIKAINLQALEIQSGQCLSHSNLPNSKIKKKSNYRYIVAYFLTISTT